MNLILVHQKSKQDRADFETIARQIGERAPEFRVFVVDTKQADWADPQFEPAAPTLTVSPMPIKRFSPPSGALCQGHEFPKDEQYRRLTRVGVRVPDWIEIGPDTVLDPLQWGPYVVVKPALGRKGAEIFIKRAGRVRYHPPESFEEGHPARRAPLLAQRFIYTGKWPSNFRVVTFFGRALMSWRCEASHRYVPLHSRWDFKAKGGITVVSNKQDSSYALAYDADVIALAEKAHAAFPAQPLLGTDIVRDADT
ncbi:MAG: hypothetical protein ABI654_02450, partial [Betaproteobacteria bacterium]